MNIASGNARVGTQIGGIGKTRSYATCPACGQAAPVNVEITDDDMQVTCSNCGNPRN